MDFEIPLNVPSKILLGQAEGLGGVPKVSLAKLNKMTSNFGLPLSEVKCLDVSATGAHGTSACQTKPPSPHPIPETQ